MNIKEVGFETIVDKGGRGFCSDEERRFYKKQVEPQLRNKLMHGFRPAMRPVSDAAQIQNTTKTDSSRLLPLDYNVKHFKDIDVHHVWFQHSKNCPPRISISSMKSKLEGLGLPLDLLWILFPQYIPSTFLLKEAEQHAFHAEHAQSISWELPRKYRLDIEGLTLLDLAIRMPQLLKEKVLDIDGTITGVCSHWLSSNRPLSPDEERELARDLGLLSTPPSTQLNEEEAINFDELDWGEQRSPLHMRGGGCDYEDSNLTASHSENDDSDIGGQSYHSFPFSSNEGWNYNTPLSAMDQDSKTRTQDTNDNFSEFINEDAFSHPSSDFGDTTQVRHGDDHMTSQVEEPFSSTEILVSGRPLTHTIIQPLKNQSQRNRQIAQRSPNEKRQRASGAQATDFQALNERRLIAASRRTDQDIDSRLKFALQTSEIQENRTGRNPRMIAQAVINGEPYEEIPDKVDDYLPMSVNNQSDLAGIDSNDASTAGLNERSLTSNAPFSALIPGYNDNSMGSGLNNQSLTFTSPYYSLSPTQHFHDATTVVSNYQTLSSDEHTMMHTSRIFNQHTTAAEPTSTRQSGKYNLKKSSQTINGGGIGETIQANKQLTGCLECRKWKRKCDNGLPACSTCVMFNYQCVPMRTQESQSTQTIGGNRQGIAVEPKVAGSSRGTKRIADFMEADGGEGSLTDRFAKQIRRINPNDHRLDELRRRSENRSDPINAETIELAHDMISRFGE